MIRRPHAVLALVAALATSAQASAEPDHDKQAAVKHFEAGRQLRDRGDCRGAIVEFNEVLKHEESVGAYFNLAQCYEATGEYRRAVDAYDKAIYAARSTSDSRSADATDGARQVRASHPWIMLRVRSEVADLEGLSIVVDDVPVPREEFNGEVFRRVPQRHVVQITAKDHEPATFQVKDHETLDVRSDMLRVRTDHPPLPPAGPLPSDTDGGAWGWQKWTGVALMTASAVPIGIGLGFAGQDVNEEGDIAQRYNAENCSSGKSPGPDCPGIRKDYNDNHDKWNRRMAIAFPIGGVLLVGGAVLFFTASSSKPPPAATIRFAPTPGGAVVTGTF